MINFADSDVPKSIRLIISSIIIVILAGGIYYLAAPVSPLTSISTETIPAEIPDTAKGTKRIIPKYIEPPETLVEYFPEDTVVSLTVDLPREENAEAVTQTDTTETQEEDMLEEDTVNSLKADQSEITGTETVLSTITSTVVPVPADSLSTTLAATGPLTLEKPTINACTAWIIMSNKPTKVTYRNCCTNTDVTITVSGSLGVCAVYGFTPTGAGVTLLSNSSCKCK